MAQESSLKPIAQESEINMASHYISPQHIWNLFYTIFDGNEYACAGAMGNMQHESGLCSDNAENSWNTLTGITDEELTQRINNGTYDLQTFLQRSWWVNSYGFGYGLSQWTDTARRTKLWEFTKDQGLDIDSEIGQFNYITWEWTNSSSHYHQYLNDMKNATSVWSATRYYCEHYEVGAWNIKRFEYAQHWYDTFGGSSGGDYYISIQRTGNGYASVSQNTANAGDLIDLTVNPAFGETLIDLYAILVSSGMSMALSVQTGTQTFTMPSDNVEIFVEFTGTTPPTPVPTNKQSNGMPIWMYPLFRKRR